MSKVSGINKWNAIVYQVYILDNKSVDNIFTEVAGFSVSSTEHQLTVCYFLAIFGFESVS
jgi:hypothetical protein